MITIVNYGMGNIWSIKNALSYLGYESQITEDPKKIFSSKKLILPGVGSFYRAMQNLEQTGISDAVKEAVLQHQVPILGICLGMQLLAESGTEDGDKNGLGLINGQVIKFPFSDPSVKIPHVGFNEVSFEATCMQDIGQGLDQRADFYFVHSYRFVCTHVEDVGGWTSYGDERFASLIHKKNIYGAQFHPEKSQSNGLKLLNNFCKLGDAVC